MKVTKLMAAILFLLLVLGCKFMCAFLLFAGGSGPLKRTRRPNSGCQSINRLLAVSEEVRRGELMTPTSIRANGFFSIDLDSRFSNSNSHLGYPTSIQRILCLIRQSQLRVVIVAVLRFGVVFDLE